MKSGEIITTISRLRDSLETLEANWCLTRKDWNDSNSRNLEENHLQPISVEVSTAFSVIQRLADVVGQAERECGPW